METTQAQVLDGGAGGATDEREIVVSRLIGAPRELVWKVWTQPEHVALWWGPMGFSNTVHEMEVRPGGVWRYTMHSPDGTDYPNRCVFQVVEPPARLSYTHATGLEGDDRQFRVQVSFEDFEEQGTATFLTMRMMFDTPAHREEMIGFGAIEGLNCTLASLDEYVVPMAKQDVGGHDLRMETTQAQVLEEGKMAEHNGTSRRLHVKPQGEREIVLSREFEAPRELVWEALSRPEHLRRWWGLRADSMSVCEMDFRVGGAWRFVVSGPQGEHGFRGEYREIVRPERVVQTFEWEGMPGHISTETLTLQERGGATLMTIVSVFDTPQDRDGMLASGMEEGAGQSYDRLEELLHEMQSAVA